MTHGFEKEAFEEYEDAALYYAEHRAGLGDDFVREIEGAIREIAESPDRFQAVGQGLRVYRLKRFPYRLYYRYSEARDHATIFAVMHERRRPGYWSHRLGGG